SPDDASSGLAFHPFFAMADHAARKGWQWSTQEVRRGHIARPGETGALVAGHVVVLGYEATSMFAGSAARPAAPYVDLRPAPDGGLAVRVHGCFVGAPCFGLARLEDRIALRLLGVVSTVDPGSRVADDGPIQWRRLVASNHLLDGAES